MMWSFENVLVLDLNKPSNKYYIGRETKQFTPHQVSFLYTHNLIFC